MARSRNFGKTKRRGLDKLTRGEPLNIQEINAVGSELAYLYICRNCSPDMSIDDLAKKNKISRDAINNKLNAMRVKYGIEDRIEFESKDEYMWRTVAYVLRHCSSANGTTDSELATKIYGRRKRREIVRSKFLALQRESIEQEPQLRV